MPTIIAGIYRFDTFAEARDWAYAHGWRTSRVLPYANGYCIQDVPSGIYVGPPNPPVRDTPQPAPPDPKTTAEIVGRGADSACPDRVDAVDAAIYVNSVWIGSVTLVPDQYGFLNTWGPSMDTWADPELIGWIHRQDDHRETVAAIVDAVRNISDPS